MMQRSLLAVTLMTLLVAAPAEARPTCDDATAHGNVVTLAALDNEAGLHVWEHEGTVELWLEGNGKAGLQFMPCFDGQNYDADWRIH